jgi:hypothetical protein
MKTIDKGSSQAKPSGYALDSLMHPAHAFAHPRHVVGDPDLTLNEKRAILAWWASDACAIESAPTMRRLPGAGRPVLFDDVMEALRTLDRQAAGYRPLPRYRRVLANRVPGVFGRETRGNRGNSSLTA